MRPQPYIGIAGFMHLHEVAHMLRVLAERSPSTHHLGVGILASAKTLYGDGNRYPKRYPKPDKIAGIFPAYHAPTVNLVHYAVPSESDASALGAPPLREQLIHAFKLGGPMCHGLQVNAVWPDPTDLKGFTEAYPQARVVLQVNPKTTPDAKALILNLWRYAWTITDVLIDASGGKGLVANPRDSIVEIAAAIRASFPHLGVGLAGGLCAEELASSEPLGIAAAFKAIDSVSLDAEGRLRPEDDRLDLRMGAEYLRDALDLARAKERRVYI